MSRNLKFYVNKIDKRITKSILFWNKKTNIFSFLGKAGLISGLRKSFTLAEISENGCQIWNLPPDHYPPKEKTLRGDIWHPFLQKLTKLKKNSKIKPPLVGYCLLIKDIFWEGSDLWSLRYFQIDSYCAVVMTNFIIIKKVIPRKSLFARISVRILSGVPIKKADSFAYWL